MSNKLGETIRTARKTRDLTQGELAKRCGMSTSEVSEIETGVQRHLVKAVQAERLAKALGIPTLMLLKLGRPKDFRVWRRAFEGGTTS